MSPSQSGGRHIDVTTVMMNDEPKFDDSAYHRLWSWELLDHDFSADTIWSQAKQHRSPVAQGPLQVNEDNEVKANISFGKTSQK